VETESKFELSRSEFERLLAETVEIRCEHQRNFYFDDNDWLLAGSNATCRLREVSGLQGEVTLKLPLAGGPNRPRRMEELTWRDADVADAFRRAAESVGCIPVRLFSDSVVQHAFELLGVSQLCFRGAIETARHVVRYHELTFELDEVALPNGLRAYEIEFESNDPAAHTTLRNSLQRVVGQLRPSQVSKFQRFRAALENFVG
jgi:uncharacterized protein YjbK